MLTRTSTALALAALALAAPAAQAKLPEKGGKTIVPGSSIGGVKLGMTGAAAVKKWGKGSECDETVGSSCHWRGSMTKGSMRFDLLDGKVAAIVIQVGQKPTTYDSVYKGPITKWKTKKGIHIGSNLSTVARKYPKAEPDGGGIALRSGKRTTHFSSSGGRVATISIQNY